MGRRPLDLSQLPSRLPAPQSCKQAFVLEEEEGKRWADGCLPQQRLLHDYFRLFINHERKLMPCIPNSEFSGWPLALPGFRIMLASWCEASLACWVHLQGRVDPAVSLRETKCWVFVAVLQADGSMCPDVDGSSGVIFSTSSPGPLPLQTRGRKKLRALSPI